MTPGSSALMTEYLQKGVQTVFNGIFVHSVGRLYCGWGSQIQLDPHGSTSHMIGHVEGKMPLSLYRACCGVVMLSHNW